MIRQAEEERSFHIFYQLLAGTSQEQKRKEPLATTVFIFGGGGM